MGSLHSTFFNCTEMNNYIKVATLYNTNYYYKHLYYYFIIRLLFIIYYYFIFYYYN